MMLRALNGVLLLLVLANVLLADSATASQTDSATASQAEDELLAPEIAFRFSARLISRDTLEVHYRIADGYYMYRDRYRFSLQPESIGLGDPQLPSGEVHEDEFFGASEVYRNEVTIRLPIAPVLQSGQAIRLVGVSQGCADVGVCYLPATQMADFVWLGLPAGAVHDQ
jgi:thiol:disulfide interchange protein DsbD